MTDIGKIVEILVMILRMMKMMKTLCNWTNIKCGRDDTLVDLMMTWSDKISLR